MKKIYFPIIIILLFFSALLQAQAATEGNLGLCYCVDTTKKVSDYLTTLEGCQTGEVCQDKGGFSRWVPLNASLNSQCAKEGYGGTPFSSAANYMCTGYSHGAGLPCTTEDKAKELGCPEMVTSASYTLSKQSSCCYLNDEEKASFDQLTSSVTSTKPAAGSSSTTAEKTEKAVKPDLEVKIPGLTLSDVDLPEEGKGQADIPWIAEYINVVYKIAFALGTLIGVVWLMIGGLLYLTSGGNQTMVGKAKNFMTNAIFGLIILIFSYLILYMINPNLIKSKMVNLQTVERQDPENAVGEPFGDMSLLASGVTDSDIKTISAGCQAGQSKKPYIPASGDPKYLGLFECELKYNRKLDDISTVIIHEGGKSVEQTIKIWQGVLQKKGLPVGAHYIIERDGKIYQIIGEERVAIHANSANKKAIGIDLVIPSDCSQSTKSSNFYTCANYTQAQYDALRGLIMEISKRTGVVFNDAQVLGHCQVPDATHADPRGFDWTKIGLNPSKHVTAPDYPATRPSKCIKTPLK